MKEELARNYRASPAGSIGRTGSLKGIPRPAATNPALVRLDWTGREEAVTLAGSPPRAKLRKVPELSTGEGCSGNAIIHADNLPAMAALTPTLRGRVDLAFLEPPYNAARERWVYPDPILGWFGSVVGAEGEDPLCHDKWPASMRTNLLLPPSEAFSSRTAWAVVPLPAKGSRTSASGPAAIRRMRRRSPTGLGIKG